MTHSLYVTPSLILDFDANVGYFTSYFDLIRVSRNLYVILTRRKQRIDSSESSRLSNFGAGLYVVTLKNSATNYSPFHHSASLVKKLDFFREATHQQ